MWIENAPLLALFFVVATIYSSVGFGGGSSYVAALVFFGVSYNVVPKIALICNLIVVTGSIFHFVRYKCLSLPHILPFVVASIPFSFFGAMLWLDPFFFYLILGFVLLISSLKIFFLPKFIVNYEISSANPSIYLAFLFGAIIGFISGLSAIGGGVFLVPLYYFFRWGTPTTIAASSAFFIWCNSFSGLLGQLQKGETIDFLAYWPFFLAVLLGSQVGSFLLHKKFSQKKVEIMTGLLLFFISITIMVRAFRTVT